jgi:excisionase family DNA binding protein
MTIEYMTMTQFADEVGISRQAVHKAINKGRIKKVERIGEIILIHKSEVTKFKKARS